MSDVSSSGRAPRFEAPHPGAKAMPRWDAGELSEPPVIGWKLLLALLGPGLLMGGSAVGGGEWLAGPTVTARYGGALMWLATLSILGQVVYNLEICRYTLYCGEPIFSGKFRTLPGPRVWIWVYMALDFGMLFPYLAANAAVLIAMVVLGHAPIQEAMCTLEFVGFSVTLQQASFVRGLSYAIFLLAMLPLLVGGKIYNSLRVVMAIKLTIVLGFLLVLAVFHTNFATWREIGFGFLRVGAIPIQCGEDKNGNGVLDPGEDWDNDGRLDVNEYVDANGDGDVRDPEDWNDVDGDGIRDGDNVENAFLSLFQGKGLPDIDLSMIAWLGAFAAIAGNGGLTNIPISNYTRDQGWGMGSRVGAIPTVFGGTHLSLSHVGMVFEVTSDALRKWRGWHRRLLCDQLLVWMPACFIGIALPSMLSVQFLQRGTQADKFAVAGMTAKGVQENVGASWGDAWGGAFYYMTLLCGFLVLAPTISVSADGFVRRWVDVFWTASARLRRWPSHHIKRLYFTVMGFYVVLGLFNLSGPEPENLLKIAGNIYNWALGVSCFHTLAVNLTLLPRPLRPGWFMRIALGMAGTFFLLIAATQTFQAIWGA